MATIASHKPSKANINVLSVEHLVNNMQSHA